MNTKDEFIGVKELRTQLNKYIKKVQRGASFTVIRRSRPVFRIGPVNTGEDEGVWESIWDADRDNRGKGLPATEVLRILRRIKKNG